MPILTPQVPRSYNTANRVELNQVPMDVYEGELPEDVWGYYFVVGPVGTVDSGGLPWPEGTATTVLCGDGMIARFDFETEGGPYVTTSLMKTPDYWADYATATVPALSCFKFNNHGIMRLSPWLGMRNFLNTAFLPIGFDDPTTTPRLLVTIDSGQPYEVNPETLQLSAPIGTQDMWYPDGGSFWPFPLLFATAHPVWDPKTKEGFFVNWGKGFRDFIESVPMAYDAQVMCDQIKWSTTKFWNALNMGGVNAARSYLERKCNQAKNWVRVNTPECVQGVWPQQFTYLLRWTGDTDLERWNLVDQYGASVNIMGSIHQIAVTESYVILLDCAFDIGLNSVLTNPFPTCEDLDRLLRYMTARPILNESVFYIVRRADLDANPGVVGGTGMKDVNLPCRRFTVPMGACHFQADYRNANDQITLHVSHNTATDVSEWLADYDTSLYGKQATPVELRGIFPAPMDVSRLAVYVFNGETGAVIGAKIGSVNPEYWSVALYAGDTQFTPLPQIDAVGSLYWNTTGFFPEQATQFIYDLYSHYPNRITPVEVLRRMNGQGRPSTLFRTDTPGGPAQDTAVFPESHICGSPQFIVRKPSGLGPIIKATEDDVVHHRPRYGGHPIKNPDPVRKMGYIATMVYTPTGTEVWLFDSESLHTGPVCKMRSDNLVLSFTAHSCWLNKLGPPGPATVDMKGELSKSMKGRGKKYKRIFNDFVFPNLPS